MIAPGAYAAVADFANIARELGVPFCLIGAGARLLLLDWKDGVVDRRHTELWPEFRAKLFLSWDSRLIIAALCMAGIKIFTVTES